MLDTIIGSVPEEWHVTTLGELCASGGGDIQTGPFGSQLHASDYVEFGIPSVMPQNIGDNVIREEGVARITSADAERLSRYLLNPGDIVYSRRGDVERRAWVRTEQAGWLCGTGCLRVRLGDSADSRFMSYYLGHPDVRAWIVQHAIGATMPNLNTGILGSVPVAIPSSSEQLKIASVLTALDDKIAVNRSAISAAQSLLTAHFLSAMHGTVREVKLGELVSLKYGKALKEEGRTRGRIPVFGGNGVSGWHDTSLEDGPGIIVGRKGANAGSVSWSPGPFWAIDTSFYVRPIPNGLPLEFLFFLLQGAGFRNLVGDSAIPGLNREIALSTTVKLPAGDVISRFVETARPLLALDAQLAGESRSLAELRDTLLPKLMSGEIRVRDAERVVEDVTL
jgi:type I restriction enzyme, S subunit